MTATKPMTVTMVLAVVALHGHGKCRGYGFGICNGHRAPTFVMASVWVI